METNENIHDRLIFNRGTRLCDRNEVVMVITDRDVLVNTYMYNNNNNTVFI